MSKFKDTLKLIEEGLLKPMSDVEVKQVDEERLKEVVDEILSRSTKNADGSIDVEGIVNFYKMNLKELPLKFNKVNGKFYCTYNQLTTLKGAPKDVTLNFYCGSNLLTTLEGGPEKVSGVFDASFNKLTSLEGAPKEVTKDFYCLQFQHFTNKFTVEQVREVCKVGGAVYV